MLISIQIHAHYFEDGNIQLNTNRTIPPTEVDNTAAVVGKSDTELALNIMHIIEVVGVTK